ncbi:MAG TPA: hypothetical protein VLT47_03435 [Anaeromyxobacteraceae bacterium]|nr:hypothetical protein [Anaeromyxobacteraceae bacterium]
MTKRAARGAARKTVAAYRVTPAAQALIRRAAALVREPPSVYVARAAEDRARQDVSEAERAAARRRLGALLDAMEARPARLSEAEAEALGREAVAAARRRA